MSLLNTAQMVRFGGLTLLSFVLNLGLTTGLAEGAGWQKGNAYSVALGVVFIVNFFVMRHKVFRSTTAHPARQLAGYAAGSLVFRALERAAFEILHGRFGMQYQVAIIVISGIFTVVKYVVYGLTVFRPSR